MKSLFRFIQFVAQFITLGLALAFIISLFSPTLVEGLRARLNPTSTAQEQTVSFGPGPAPSDTNASRTKPASQGLPSSSIFTPGREGSSDNITYSYSKAVDRAAPAVVSIQADKRELRKQMWVPKDPYWRARIAGIPVENVVQTQSLGSGVIFNSDGYVVTSNHVIEGAEGISAILGDGRTAKAKLVGKDSETDLAVLKLDLLQLPIIPVADRVPDVGDVVLAIGNPFGLNNTVTMGIISARGRPIDRSQQPDQTSYEDFIQTDAAINQGNSGGALVNALGELVGINSDVFTLDGRGGNIGIGFAVPVTTAKYVLNQIVAHGHVIRGWMGVNYADSTPDPNGTAQRQQRGVLVRSVAPETPAAKAGLQAGDRLVEFNDRPIASQFDLHARESELQPGTNVHLSGMRDGKPFSLNLTLQEKPQIDSSPPIGAAVVPTG
jgi:serine peptidase DegS